MTERNQFGRDLNQPDYRISAETIAGLIGDGRMRPGPSYAGMTVEAIAADYLAKCDALGICAGCNNPLNKEDREFSGATTNACIPCACY